MTEAYRLIGNDLRWVTLPSHRHSVTLKKLPSLLDWEQLSNTISDVQILARSVNFRRFYSCLNYIHFYDVSLALSMRETFDLLPEESKLRFLMAPETFFTIGRFTTDPAGSTILLCRYLNGEATLVGQAPARPLYMTALGDVFWVASDGTIPETVEKRSLMLGKGIVVDFYSHNVERARNGSGTSVKGLRDFTESEAEVAYRKLVDAFTRVEQLCPAAAELINTFVRVIVPIQPIEIVRGSTSQSQAPGRIFLKGIEHTSLTGLANALVHEAIHQIIYILELAGRFTFGSIPGTVISPWSGRALELHSYIHACFVWYGLAKFWTIDGASAIFPENEIAGELNKAMRGFLGANPIELLAAYPGAIRGDVLQVAGTLQGRLSQLLPASSQVDNILAHA